MLTGAYPIVLHQPVLGGCGTRGVKDREEAALHYAIHFGINRRNTWNPVFCT